MVKILRLAHLLNRFDDPYLLERYRMMTQQTFSPYAHPGMLGPPGMHPLLPPGARYPPELLGQHLPLVSPGSKLPDHMSPSNDRYVFSILTFMWWLNVFCDHISNMESHKKFRDVLTLMYFIVSFSFLHDLWCHCVSGHGLYSKVFNMRINSYVFVNVPKITNKRINSS